MTRPPEWLPWVPAVVLAVFAAAVLARVVFEGARYVRAGRVVRPMWRRAWRIRWTWAQTARRVGLVHTERSSPPWWPSAKPGTAATKQLVPPIRVRADRWGVQVEASTVGRVGLVEFQNAARHLADAWRVPTVQVTQPKAGLVRLRALVVDPLTEPLQWTDTELAGMWRRVEVHGVAGSCAVISHSFTDLLAGLIACRGEYIFWEDDSFVSLGDAYD